ncbi:hypothetical protein Hanom_Chr09g00795011 [Helianthus anomalus]
MVSLPAHRRISAIRIGGRPLSLSLSLSISYSILLSNTLTIVSDCYSLFLPYPTFVQ